MNYNNANIPIFQKSYDLYKLIHQTRNNIPKADRYTIWQKSEDTCLNIIESLFSANQTTGKEKLLLLKEISNKTDLLRIFMRLSYETKTINEKKHIQIQTYLNEIGKMIGGWIKNSKHK